MSAVNMTMQEAMAARSAVIEQRKEEALALEQKHLKYMRGTWMQQCRKKFNEAYPKGLKEAVDGSGYFTITFYLAYPISEAVLIDELVPKMRKWSTARGWTDANPTFQRAFHRESLEMQFTIPR
jgi:hypothetical protein